MNKDLKKFLIKALILVVIIFITRFIFQFPIEYFNIQIFKHNAANWLFNKIIGLEILALVGLFFGLYYKKQISKLPHPKFDWKLSVLFLIIAEIIVVIYYLIRASTNYFNITGGWLLYVVQFAIFLSLALAFAFFALAVFDIDYLNQFIKAFWKKLVIAAVIAVILYQLLIFFQNQWLFFSTGVANILARVLSLFYPVVYYTLQGSPVIRIYDFSVSIGAPCSGIDSMFLFTAFFAALFALDKERLKKGLYILVFIIGLLGVYLVNVLRLLLLIIAGVHISPRFAIGLFHTNAGWVFFIAYFLCYYLIVRKFIYKNNLPVKK